MAANITKPGGVKSDKIITDALRIAMKREVQYQGKLTRRIVVMADKVAEAAMNCEQWAVKEVWDRLEGKAHQAIQVDGTIEHKDIDAVAILTDRIAGIASRISAEADSSDKDSIH